MVFIVLKYNQGAQQRANRDKGSFLLLYNALRPHLP